MKLDKVLALTLIIGSFITIVAVIILVAIPQTTIDDNFGIPVLVGMLSILTGASGYLFGSKDKKND